MMCAEPAWSPPHTLIWRLASMATVAALAMSAVPLKFTAEAKKFAASPGVTATKFGPVGAPIVMLYVIAVAPTGTASSAFTAPAASWPSLMLIVLDAFG